MYTTFTLLGRAAISEEPADPTAVEYLQAERAIREGSVVVSIEQEIAAIPPTRSRVRLRIRITPVCPLPGAACCRSTGRLFVESQPDLQRELTRAKTRRHAGLPQIVIFGGCIRKELDRRGIAGAATDQHQHQRTAALR